MLDFRRPIFFQTNASFYGFSALCSHDWFAGSWTVCPAADHMLLHNPHWSTAGHAIDSSLCSNINYLELFPILLAARRWGPTWVNKCVCVETDNTQAMSFINKGMCKNPIVQFRILRSCWETAGFSSSRHKFCTGSRLTLYTLLLFGFLSSKWIRKRADKKRKQEGNGKRRKQRSQGKECAAAECSSFEYNNDGIRSGLHFFKFPTKNPAKACWCN